MTHASYNALSTKSIYADLISCLQQYSARMEALEDLSYEERLRTVTEITAFLQKLASISATCKKQLATLTSPQDYHAMQQILSYLIKDKDQKVLQDLDQINNTATKQQELLHSNRQKSAMAEQHDITARVHQANVDSMPHDKMRYLGDLLEGSMRREYLIPFLEDAYGPSKVIQHQQQTTNSYEEYLHKRYGGDAGVYQGPKK